MTAPDITVVITGHREGIIAGPSIRSALIAMEAARQQGIEAELLVTLDRTDEVTRSIFSKALGGTVNILELDEGDPGQARNRAVEAASGTFVTFLDADDLWSANWLTCALEAARHRPDAIHHSFANAVFGDERNLWFHIDSESASFDPHYLEWSNYWDAMSFAERSIFLEYPFRANDLDAGFGHEDWHWNCVTLASGFAHKVVPGTMHFKRRRKGSQMTKVARSNALIWPDKL